MTLDDLPPFADAPLPDDASKLIRYIILAYLVHHCYGDTARTFAAAGCDGAGDEAVLRVLQQYRIDFASKSSAGPSSQPRAVTRNASSMDIDDDGITSGPNGTADSGSSSAAVGQAVSSLAVRKDVLSLVLQGRIDEALQQTHRYFPGVLVDVGALDTFASVQPPASAPASSDALRVTFQLHCQHFIELVRRNRQPEALLYAQEVLSKFGLARPQLLETLKDVGALIAYQDPATSPVCHFLSAKHREDVAEALNSAILIASRLPPKPALECIVQQLSTVRECLGSELNGKDKKSMSKILRRWKIQDFLQGDV